MTIVGISDIVIAIDASSFPQVHKDSRKEVLTTSDAVGGIRESKFQHWESLMAFTSSSVVAAKGAGAFTTKTLHLYLRMGLRDPSEKTFRALADLISIGTQGMEKAMTMNSDQRQAALDYVKALFRNAVNGLPPSDLALLPSTPEDLQVVSRRHTIELIAQIHPKSSRWTRLTFSCFGDLEDGRLREC